MKKCNQHLQLNKECINERDKGNYKAAATQRFDLSLEPWNLFSCSFTHCQVTITTARTGWKGKAESQPEKRCAKCQITILYTCYRVAERGPIQTMVITSMLRGWRLLHSSILHKTRKHTIIYCKNTTILLTRWQTLSNSWFSNVTWRKYHCHYTTRTNGDVQLDKVMTGLTVMGLHFQ